MSESDYEISLRQGLRELPVPSVSADFDSRVLAAIASPVPWWRALVPALRPAASASVCSLIATLALLHWATGGPIATPIGRVASQPSALSIDTALDQPDQRAGTLNR